MDARRALVVGGTGFIGRYVVAELLQRGYRVSVLSRRCFVEDATHELVRGDTEQLDEDGWAELLAGHDAVVFAAGRDDRTVPPAPAAPYFHQGNVAPVERLAAAARRMGCRSLVVLGSYFTAIDRQRPQLALANRHPYIRSRVEQAAAARRAAGPELPVAVLEIPFVFGASPGRPSLWAPAGPLLRSRLPLFAPPGGTAVVPVRAVAQAAAGAVERRAAGDYPVAAENLGWAQLVERMALAAGRPGPVRVHSMPASVLHAAMRGVGVKHRLRRLEPGLSARLVGPLLTSDLFLDPSVCRDELGVVAGGSDELDEAIRDSFST
ncbi:NAD-dependent epimerase/dehydratase family protein [Kitasatospora sp. MAP5-34]|uniref:NAD-dependent epimerase/dehydratase family protein n=1 Tax=Kitasatospora sp. MAP5-34 TaxID=3035102 RepID=UPI0024768D04|nr:NAD-dependent epimerase/dehydratase family protein [Kitasatospora sp. MAP5-34]MDH6577366.1 dihydroflavonol-4-reductase [Kitasatospora sp. MAP5-34]